MTEGHIQHSSFSVICSSTSEDNKELHEFTSHYTVSYCFLLHIPDYICLSGIQQCELLCAQQYPGIQKKTLSLHSRSIK